MAVDLHMHSNASDGRYSPAELVSLAVKAGLTVMALTDHDSTEGVARALEEAGKYPRLKLIPGVEIGTDVPHGEVHVLGYFIDYEDKELKEKLADMRNSRGHRATRMIAKLYNLGMDIEWRRVLELAGDGSVGRPHVALAMVEKGYVGSFKEAFDKYIGREGPAYAERDKMTPEEAVELIIKAGGIAVLAHPYTVSGLEKMLAEMKKAGLAGVEVYSPGATPDEVKKFHRLAKGLGLLITGGSDFHGLDTGSDVPLGQFHVPDECAEALLAREKSRRVK
ncbi:MAG: PHP domain-containing protein [Dehalococcoidia bacterium]|nr:PHP domain-containing protein [Dehalococcoidia bacterium]MDZ4246826.1 PHP domain-containing protein [Dehalococcoidia bacterium]